MSEEKKLNRGWVKNAAIIFLIVMLLLTFFSQTILNRTLPEVAVQYAQSGTINAKIRGSGTVTANQTYEVNFNQSREVASVPIKVGDTVAVGDVLFTLADKESDELKAARDLLSDLNLAYQTALIDASSADYSQLEREIELAQNALMAAIEKRDRGSVSQATLDAAKQHIDELNSDLAELQNDLDDTGFSMADAAALLAQERKIEDIRASINDPGEDDDEDDLRVQLRRAEEDYESMEEAISISEDIRDTNTELSEAKAFLAELQEKTDWESASKAVEEAQKALDDKVFELGQKRSEDNKTTAKDQLALQAQRAKLGAQQELVNKLVAESVDAVVTAKQAGVVKSINIAAGQTSTPGEALAVIEAPDLGYSLSFSVTNEQAKRVKVGDTAEVTNYYWGAEIKAVLAKIKNDPEKKGQNKLLEFNLTGEVETGSQLTVALGQPSATYEYVVPLSALRTDGSGDFVLNITSKQTPLGTRYIATRVDVRVLARDDNNAAVSGALSGWDYVITTSNKPVEPGAQVRLVDQ